MANYDIRLRPVHYASVSGGKDSLYMLGVILTNLDKYPLDCVVHYELEIDWGWVKNVIDEMERRCKLAGIPFYRIKPRDSWYDLQKKYLFPSRVTRWCNSKYKMDAEKQMREWVKAQNCRPIAYIGLCADENKRFKYEIGSAWELGDKCYPLAEEGIEESTILEWAKTQDIFQGWYKHFNRQGCKFCPLTSFKEIAYMSKYEPDSFKEFSNYIREYEDVLKRPMFKEPWNVIEKRILTKWVSILEQEENQYTFLNEIYEEEKWTL